MVPLDTFLDDVKLLPTQRGQDQGKIKLVTKSVRVQNVSFDDRHRSNTFLFINAPVVMLINKILDNLNSSLIKFASQLLIH